MKTKEELKSIVKSSRGAPSLVRLGDLDLNRVDDGSEHREYSVADIIVHENYRPPVKYNDIALLKLNREVEFSKFIRPACLWTKFSTGQDKVIATGWGRTGTGEEQSDRLLKVGLSVFHNSECDRTFPTTMQIYRRALPQGITDKMMCAGEKKGGKDTCQVYIYQLHTNSEKKYNQNKNSKK
ncbi:serine protease snake-like [Agrilus planipennis]|uniref:Serine protease snake-like n=1 Tax=Agrilus planipennis TaxID=224129 RepID=A0A7F5RN10_AGRPL|nr:serine protease snake-like [Agrilus planipennis]